MNKLIKLMILATSFLTSVAMADDWWTDIKNDRVSEVTQALAQRKNPNSFSQEGHTAIIYAIRQNSHKVAMALANDPATNVNQANRFDETPLMYAAITGDMQLAKLLIKRGAKVNRLGWAPLHYAASKGQKEMVAFLLAQGAFPNAPAADGSSPLLLAVTSRNPEVVQALLDAGADPRAINQQGKSALSVAKEMQLDSIVNLLEAHAMMR